MKYLFSLALLAMLAINAAGQTRETLDLNGTWDFEQTLTAYPPAKFTRKIPIPGLVHLAKPRIEEYDKFFRKPEKVVHNPNRNILAVDYTPRYSWYRKTLQVAAGQKGKNAVLTIGKSQYGTQVFVNGIDLGSFVECYTPIEVDITRALKYGQANEILLKVGDRYWLPSHAAGSTDKEKEHYLPGIWDDVTLSFTNASRVHRLLVLPNLKEKKVQVKAQIWNLARFQVLGKDPVNDSVFYVIAVKDRSGQIVGKAQSFVMARRDFRTEVSVVIDIKNAYAWTPSDPYLYTAEMTVGTKDRVSDSYSRRFGMRDFERRDKNFYLNDEKFYLRGSNITLQRFFEDPECADLAWNKEWVKKMLIDIPKKLDMNAMRICVSLVPDFWYDLADEYGMVFQNEWLYWQHHGWSDQVRREYTDWVWNDGSHPSIVIWDGINENRESYIGNVLIPELQKLDPTRIWDAGYMTAANMANDEMDEPHTYMGRPWDEEFQKKPYPLGNLDYRSSMLKKMDASKSAQLVNEYGWVWLWRDGTASKLTTGVYDYYLGEGSTVEQRRFFQAYWLQCETEWLRSNRNIAGILAFCLLTNNYGYTGDWFVGNIASLTPGPVLHAFKDCFAEANVFINLTDERYTKLNLSHAPGSELKFSLSGVSDAGSNVMGQVKIKLLDADGKEVWSRLSDIIIPPRSRIEYQQSLTLPSKPGGYLLITEFEDKGKKLSSRRYVRVGSENNPKFFEPVVGAF